MTRTIRVGDTVRDPDGRVATVLVLYRADAYMRRRAYVEYGSGRCTMIAYDALRKVTK